MAGARPRSPAAEKVSLARFAPHAPWPKQRAFLNLACQEAFYGGAAAGGKSEALLMAALQYAHVPGYSALILRKDMQRLRLAGGLIPRSHEWLTGKAEWNGRDHRWLFPTGGAPASLSFGYLQTPQDKYRYGSSEYQYIAFDELTEFPEDDYLFLFSRLRKTRSVPVPLRLRAASNPGNLGHDWVRRRFVPLEFFGDESSTCDSSLRDSSSHADVLYKGPIAFVPARIRDNPAVDEAEYRATLAHLPPVVRERLMNGDWSVREEGLIQASWLRYFVERGEQLDLLNAGGEVLSSFDGRTARRIATIDPAGTSADKAREQRGRPASYSVIEVWDQPPAPLDRFLLLRHVWRARVGFEGLCAAIRDVFFRWRPNRLYIENEKLGQAACDVLSAELPLETIRTAGRDKVARAGVLITRLERGEIFLPRFENAWRAPFETELLSWTGLADETSDQIDAAAYAAEITAGGGELRVERFW